MAYSVLCESFAAQTVAHVVSLLLSVYHSMEVILLSTFKSSSSVTSERAA